MIRPQSPQPLTRYLTVLVALLALARVAHGDPMPLTNAHLKSGATCTTPGGASIVLAPGYFLGEAERAAIDAETKRLQDAETRLTAENGALRATVASWQPGFYTLALTLAAGVALGVYVQRKL